MKHNISYGTLIIGSENLQDFKTSFELPRPVFAVMRSMPYGRHPPAGVLRTAEIRESTTLNEKTIFNSSNPF
jgi:hypothetical protein